MQLWVVEDADALGARAAAWISSRVSAQPRLVLGLAAGNTPRPVYREFVRLSHSVDFSELTTFNLDEYLGLPQGDPRTFAHQLEVQLTGPLARGIGARYVLPSDTDDVDDACRAYELSMIAAGGVDIQLLGIGRNGHLAFNEPGSAFDSRTRMVELSEETRRANARDFGEWESVPERALTMGLGTIADARCCMLLADGETKAAILDRALSGPVDESCPASILQRHPDLIVIADRAAASQLAP